MAAVALALVQLGKHLTALAMALILGNALRAYLKCLWCVSAVELALTVLRVQVQAAAAAALTGVSKAASLRNLDEFERRNLVREITGQGRFRFWTAGC
jgi:Fic family protein